MHIVLYSGIALEKKYEIFQIKKFVHWVKGIEYPCFVCNLTYTGMYGVYSQ